jgi:hypothetical protein
VGGGDEDGRHGSQTLLKARDSLKLASAEEPDDDRQPGDTGNDERVPVVRFQPGRYDHDSVRTAVRSDPEFARLLARDILDELKQSESTESVSG